MATNHRHIRLCADDYGISPSVNAAIRELIENRRINATSVMMVAPHLGQAEADKLAALHHADPRVAIGLHVTLTGLFRPASPGFAPARDGTFLPLEKMALAAIRRRLHRDRLATEIATQLRAFQNTFGRSPDFVDSHQHIHLFPQVRDALLEMVKAVVPDAWVRQCGRAIPLHRRANEPKSLVLDLLSLGFCRRARALGLRTNPAFSGSYTFAADADYARLFPAFLDSLPDGGLVMCHPGIVDDELVRLDPLTTLREREYDYFRGEEFPRVLAANNIELA
ncbi:MAG TPA: ChbG/HpnK family deacetylase [Pseudolabrys sp.]|nr:ChbG/HpnK family deacetylase [Pseudolabrys sp.]